MNLKNAALITLYNPEKVELILQNLELLLRMEFFVVLVDDFSREEFLNPIKEFVNNKNNIILFIKDINLGIGHSLNLGCRYLKSLNYNWVLTLDQDTILEKEWIFNLNNQKDLHIQELEKAFIFHSLPKDPNTLEVFDFYLNATNKENISESHFSFTSGSFMSLSIWEKLGEFDESLYLDYIDIDICHRARLAGYKIYAVKNVIMLHTVGSRSFHRSFGKTFILINHSPWRLYYIIRNSYLLRKIYGKEFPIFKQGDRKFILKRIIKTILFENQRIQKLFYILLGFFHGLYNKKGKLRNLLFVDSISSLKQNYKIYSFDVFDTLITRIYADPRDPIRVACRKVTEKTKLSWEEIFRIRMHSEEISRFLSTHDDVTIDEIYEYLENNYPYWNHIWNELKDLEWKEELESVIAVWENYHLLNKLKQMGKLIVLVSDMYLKETQIRILLEKCGYNLDGIKIYVSSEARSSKHSGKLFKILKNDFKSIGRILHIGDNYYSDVIQANKSLITTNHFLETHLHETSRSFIQSTEWNETDSRFIGLLRKLRLNFFRNSEQKTFNDKIISDFTINILAPFILGIVLWLKKTKRHDEVLYFVARDGRFIFEMYQRLFPDDEVYYIHGSRKAWFLPCMDIEDDLDYDWLFLKDHPKSWKYISNKLEISEEIKTSIDKKYKLKDDTELTQKTLKSILLDYNFKNAIERIISDRKDRLIAYLKHLQVHTKKASVADLGWTFKTVSKINKLLKSINIKPLGSYFVSCFYEHIPSYIAGDLKVYLPHGTSNLIHLENSHLFWKNYQVIEQALFSPPEKSTVDYCNLNGLVKPIFEEGQIENYRTKESIQLHLIRFADSIKESNFHLELNIDSIKIGSFKNIIHFLENKYPVWMGIFKDYKFSVDHSSEVKNSLETII